MSSFRDLKSQLRDAISLFEVRDYGESLDAFAELLQKPRIRTRAARIFLDLFTEQARFLVPFVSVKPVIGLVRLSINVLTDSKDKVTAQRTSEQVRDILQELYKIDIPESMSLRIVLRDLPAVMQPPDEREGFSAKTSRDVRAAAEKPDAAGGGGGTGGGSGDVGGTDGGDGGRAARFRREPQVIRTPHMDVDAGPPFQPNTTFYVRVWASTEGRRPGEETEDVVLEGGKEEYRLKVLLITSSGLTVDGPESQPLTINIHEQRSSCEKPFPVRVNSAEPLQKATISALFSYEGRQCGRVTRVLPTLAGADDPPDGVHVQPAAEKPDLTVTIAAHEFGDEQHFACIVTTPHIADYVEGVKDENGWHVRRSAPEIVNGQIAAIKDKGTDATSRHAALRVAGLELFESSPALFRKVFWRLEDERKPLRTIQIISEETSYPWELMIPNGDGRPEQEQPLGVRCAVGRWITRANDSPRQAIDLKNAYVIAPKYNDDRELKSAPDEIKSLNACFQAAGRGPVRQIEPPDVPTIDACLVTQGVTLLHFICHGKAGARDDPENSDPADQVLILDNEKPLSARTIRGLRGFVKAFREMHPLVFLNACEVGQQVPALSGVGGFAQSFIRIGASGIIAALWPVDDSIACHISQKFYEDLQKNGKIRTAEFLQELRKLAYDEQHGDDTYAAYCFYGDPCGEVAIRA